MKCTTRTLAAAGVLIVFSIFATTADSAENGPTIKGEVCMQKTFGTPVTNSNRVNCTANDIRLSRAISVSPSTCTKGTTFDLTATFETIVTANARYDAGFFFRVDGVGNARGDEPNATGSCSLSALSPPPPLNEPALQLDGDSCGDLNSGTYEVTFTIPDVKCEAAPGTDQLRLPNCTSWHSNSSTACEVSDPFSVTDAPYFHPDTKSKCVCDDNFTVPVKVENATISVTKSASPVQKSEPGGAVTFTVQVTNDAQIEPVTIYSIVDDVHGDVGKNVGNLTYNTCPTIIGKVLDKGTSASCSFTDDVWGNAGYSEKDTVEVTAYQESTGAYIHDSDDATVTIINLAGDKEPSVNKTAQSVAACQVDVTYQVVVNNNSSADTLTVNSLKDNKFGDITAVHDATSTYGKVVSTTCGLPADPIATNGNFTCEFVGRIVDNDCDIDHTDTVTATVTDDDKISWDTTDDAIVSVVATP